MKSSFHYFKYFYFEHHSCSSTIPSQRELLFLLAYFSVILSFLASATLTYCMTSAFYTKETNLRYFYPLLRTASS